MSMWRFSRFPVLLTDVLNSLEGDHEFLLEGDVFTPDWLDRVQA